MKKDDEYTEIDELLNTLLHNLVALEVAYLQDPNTPKITGEKFAEHWSNNDIVPVRILPQKQEKKINKYKDWRKYEDRNKI
jgi:hypothetical protein